MNKIRAKAIPVTEKNYPCLIQILALAEQLPNRRGKFKLSPDRSVSVICLDELDRTKPEGDDFIVRGAPENEPYFLSVHGSLLVAARPDGYFYYPLVGNATGYEFDSYTEPSEQDCSFKMIAENEDIVNGIFFKERPGCIETWWYKL